jgi:lipopolysaccharide export system permease protein
MLESEVGFAMRDVPVTLDFVSVPSLIGGDASTRTLLELATMSRAARNQGDIAKLNGIEASLWFRIALPTMCLAFAIICPPLAIRFSQAGSFAGILVSIILAFVTWNTLLLLQAAAGAGLLPAPLSAFIPHALTLCGAMWLYKTLD